MNLNQKWLNSSLVILSSFVAIASHADSKVVYKGEVVLAGLDQIITVTDDGTNSNTGTITLYCPNTEVTTTLDASGTQGNGPTSDDGSITVDTDKDAAKSLSTFTGAKIAGLYGATNPKEVNCTSSANAVVTFHSDATTFNYVNCATAVK